MRVADGPCFRVSSDVVVRFADAANSRADHRLNIRHPDIMVRDCDPYNGPRHAPPRAHPGRPVPPDRNVRRPPAPPNPTCFRVQVSFGHEPSVRGDAAGLAADRAEALRSITIGAATVPNGRPWIAEDPVMRASVSSARPDLLRPIETAGRIVARASRSDEPCCWLIFGQVGVSVNLRDFPLPGFGRQEMSGAGARVCRGRRTGAGLQRPSGLHRLRERPYSQGPRPRLRGEVVHGVATQVWCEPCVRHPACS